MHNTAEGVEESVGACVYCVDRSQLAQDILPPWRDFAGLLGGAGSSGEREE